LGRFAVYAFEDNAFIFKQIYKQKAIHTNRVITTMDKNNGTIFSFCPKTYQNKLIDLYDYTKQTSNYKKATTDRNAILKQWQQKFESLKNKSDIGTFNKKGDIPLAYGIPKFKDFNRYRPIVSYSNHPLKRVFNRVSRGLMFLLEQINPPTVLFRIFELTKKIQEFAEKNKHVNKFYALTLDIKNMYTNLPQKEVINAIQILFDLVKNVKRTKWITINKHTQRGVRWGRRVNPRTTVEMTYQQLIHFVELDMFYCYFTLGQQIIQQVIGIPMGSPISPTAAIILCTIAEQNWLQILHTKHIINNSLMLRYIDDILLLFANHNQHDTQTKQILDILKQQYPKQLTLLIEHQGQKVEFLETIIKIKQNQILIQHKNKNYKHIEMGKGQKFLNLVYFNTFAEKAQNIGVAIGTLIRIAGIANTIPRKLKDLVKIIIELNFLNYSDEIIIQAIRKIERTHDDTIWKALRQMLQFMQQQKTAKNNLKNKS